MTKAIILLLSVFVFDVLLMGVDTETWDNFVDRTPKPLLFLGTVLIVSVYAFIAKSIC